MKEAIISAFNYRHACKEFDPNKKIPDADFETILEVARLSPSSFGFEPWKFLVVQNETLREKLTEYCWGGKKQIPTSSHTVVCLVKKGFFMRYDSDYVEHFLKDIQHLPDEIKEMKHAAYQKFQEVDFNLLESERAITDWAAKQTYIPMANMMSVAAMLGIDSCPIEGFSLKETEVILGEAFGIDTEKYALGYILTFGYRIKEPRPKTRQRMDEIVEWFR